LGVFLSAVTIEFAGSLPLSINKCPCDIDHMKVKDLIALIESDGWWQIRQKGSHRQFHHPTKSGTVTVAGKPSIDVPPGTLLSVLKQAGLKH
jgi:predicted RNA binding protein YcfA (HicA-like mRNA interferase family)